MPSKGIFLLDIEVELAWGTIDKEMDKPKVKLISQKTRTYFDALIGLLEKYQIPVTWGILGHLILDRCERKMGVPHPEMPRPSYKWLKRDWYEHDPCKDITEEPAFYGKDIVEKIVKYTIKTRIPHDIACHSFSHQLFNDSGCAVNVAEAEVKQCIKLMKGHYNIQPKVFIFPRDRPGHLDVLQRSGFIAFRGRIPSVLTYAEETSVPVGKYIFLAAHFLSFYIFTPPPVVVPKRENGLINIPASLCYNEKPFIPLRFVTAKAIKGIEKAIRERKILHLYTHLFNLGQASNPEAFLKGFEKILAYVDVHRDDLEKTTIRKIAEDLIRGDF